MASTDLKRVRILYCADSNTETEIFDEITTALHDLRCSQKNITLLWKMNCHDCSLFYDKYFSPKYIKTLCDM